MFKQRLYMKDGLFTLAILLVAFCVNLLMQWAFKTQTMTPLTFVLGVFLISLRTYGYFWGIAASLVSVLAVNYAFTYPYWEFDLISPECITSAIVMLVVAVMTGALTTKLKQQEKMKAEAEKERMRGNLLRAVSHDLRTPLTSIYGACSAMIDNYDEISKEKKIKLLQDMSADAQWLVRMVENLLSVTHIDGQGIQLRKNDTVLEELIDTVLVKFRKHYPTQSVHVQIPTEFISIPMDAMLIQQVLMNLLENAVFHAKDMKNLWLTVEIKEQKAEFRVEDDGCGIPQERMASLFTGLFARTVSADNNRSGMGIGLSVCNAIVKAHGGEMIAQNRQGGGAEFRFLLDMEDVTYGEQ